MGMFGDWFKGFGDHRTARKAGDYAEKQKKQNLELINQLNYDPMYAADVTPTYKKTESPVARAYLESFLMGNNPDATFSGRPNAAYTKQQQQLSQNQMFGTPEQRIARSQQLQTETPWKVTAPTRRVDEKAGKTSAVGDPSGRGKAMLQAESPWLAEAGVDPKMAAALKEHGVRLDDKQLGAMAFGFSGDTGKVMEAVRAAYDAGDFDAIKRMTGQDGGKAFREMRKWMGNDDMTKLARRG